MRKPRSINLEHFPAIDEKIVTLIRVSTAGEITFAIKPEQKLELLKTAAEEDVFVATWMGKMTTDAFKVTAEVRAAWVEALDAADA